MLDDAGLGISGSRPLRHRSRRCWRAYRTILTWCFTTSRCATRWASKKLRTETIDPADGDPRRAGLRDRFLARPHLERDRRALRATAALKFVWEFEPGFLFNKPSEVVRMMVRVDHPNFNVMFDSCHAHMCAVVGARQMGEKETLPGGVVQFIHMLTGKIGTCTSSTPTGRCTTTRPAPMRRSARACSTSTSITPALVDAGYDEEWWPIDLCFWEGALEATGPAKAFMDNLVEKYGT